MEKKIRDELNKWYRLVRRHPRDTETRDMFLGMLVLATQCGAVSEAECARSLSATGNRRRGV